MATAGKPAPFVSIVMPIRNERAFVLASLESALAGDYPAERVELLAIDGMSDDGTREILAEFVARHGQVRVLDNLERTQAHALNLGLAASRGEVIVRMDAHAVYPRDYLSRCVERLRESGADNVGGVCVTVPGAGTPTARAIAVALGHPFGVGNSRFRIGASAPRWVDTVPFGCWRREVLERLGGFATDLPHAEDDELNARLLRRGGRILLDPAIRVRYIARTRLRQLGLMLYQYGYSKPFAARRIGGITTARQLAPPALLASLGTVAVAGFAWPPAWLLIPAILATHGTAGFAAGLAYARPQGLGVVLYLPLVFAVMHGAYGYGYLRGLADLLVRGGPRRPARLSR